MYEIRFSNKRKAALTVYDRDGGAIASVQPKSSATLYTDDPLSSWAPYAEVTFLPEDPWVSLEERAGWQEPNRGDWVVRVTNINGLDVEYIAVGGQILCLMKNVPVLIAVDATDEMAPVARLDVAVEEFVKEKSAIDGIVATRRTLVNKPTFRDPDKLQHLQDVLQEMARKEESAVDGQ